MPLGIVSAWSKVYFGLWSIMGISYHFPMCLKLQAFIFEGYNQQFKELLP
jgi:hypothetical protein